MQPIDHLHNRFCAAFDCSRTGENDADFRFAEKAARERRGSERERPIDHLRNPLRYGRSERGTRTPDGVMSNELRQITISKSERFLPSQLPVPAAEKETLLLNLLAVGRAFVNSIVNMDGTKANRIKNDRSSLVGSPKTEVCHGHDGIYRFENNNSFFCCASKGLKNDETEKQEANTKKIKF